MKNKILELLRSDDHSDNRLGRDLLLENGLAEALNKDDYPFKLTCVPSLLGFSYI